MKKSIKISGDGFISEGEYDVVKIMGDVCKRSKNKWRC